MPPGPVRCPTPELDNRHLSSDTRQMALDPYLVRDAEAARERLAESRQAAERARADYHHTIRRLHAAGRCARSPRRCG